MLSGFFGGIRLLLRGFGFWARRPAVMLLGLIPAAIVFALVLAALIALGFNLQAVVDWLTPFDEGWPRPWQNIVTLATSAVLFGAAIVLSAVTFTALTLAVGDPFYERIWRAAEGVTGGPIPSEGAGFWKAVRSSLWLLSLGIVTALGVGLVGFVPLIGGLLAPALGVILSGRLLAVELSSRAFDARGISSEAQRTLRRGIRWQLLGFGVGTQLLFMIPFGAIFSMPAAVAGSTFLARLALDTAAPAGAGAAVTYAAPAVAAPPAMLQEPRNR